MSDAPWPIFAATQSTAFLAHNRPIRVPLVVVANPLLFSIVTVVITFTIV